jgi:hypothetical protein
MEYWNSLPLASRMKPSTPLTNVCRSEIALSSPPVSSVADEIEGAVGGRIEITLAMTSDIEAPCGEFVVSRVATSVEMKSSPEVAHGRNPSKRKGTCPLTSPSTCIVSIIFGVQIECPECIEFL